jgi:glycine C-acetyltransferase
LLGAGESANWPGATKAVAEWFPKRERGWAVALFDSGSSIGGAIAPFLVLWLYSTFGGWQYAFIITGTLGKALGGAMGGYTTGKKEIIELLRQRSRPYLFSNSLAPAIVGASLKVFDLIENDTTLRDKLEDNTRYFRSAMEKAGFDLVGADAAIVPVMLYDAKLAQQMANDLLKEGIYVIGFFFPVVPKGKARIRVQLSAAHTKEHIDKAVTAFIKVGKKLNVI